MQSAKQKRNNQIKSELEQDVSKETYGEIAGEDEERPDRISLLVEKEETGKVGIERGRRRQ